MTYPVWAPYRYIKPFWALNIPYRGVFAHRVVWERRSDRVLRILRTRLEYAKWFGTYAEQRRVRKQVARRLSYLFRLAAKKYFAGSRAPKWLKR